MGKRATLMFAVVAFASAALLPLVWMLAQSVVVDGRFSFGLYAKVFSSPLQQWTLIGNSLLLALLTAAIALAIGMPLGLLLGKSDLPARRAVTLALIVPLVIPPYTLAVCWFHVIGPSGLLGTILPARVREEASNWFFGLPGCVFVLTSALMPLVLILTMASLRTINPRLEEAGRLITGWGGALRYVTLPMI